MEHVLLFRQTSTETTRLVLLEGENWLQWKDRPSLYSLSAAATDMLHLPPSHNEINLLSLDSSSHSSTETPFCCFLCLDVDGAIATVKDMRDPVEDASDDVHLLREDTAASGALVRRRLRVLREADRLLIRLPNTLSTIIEFEYRKEEKGPSFSSSSASTAVPTQKTPRNDARWDIYTRGDEEFMSALSSPASPAEKPSATERWLTQPAVDTQKEESAPTEEPVEEAPQETPGDDDDSTIDPRNVPSQPPLDMSGRCSEPVPLEEEDASDQLASVEQLPERIDDAMPHGTTAMDESLVEDHPDVEMADPEIPELDEIVPTQDDTVPRNSEPPEIAQNMDPPPTDTIDADAALSIPVIPERRIPSTRKRKKVESKTLDMVHSMDGTHGASRGLEPPEVAESMDPPPPDTIDCSTAATTSLKVDTILSSPVMPERRIPSSRKRKNLQSKTADAVHSMDGTPGEARELGLPEVARSIDPPPDTIDSSATATSKVDAARSNLAIAERRIQSTRKRKNVTESIEPTDETALMRPSSRHSAKSAAPSKGRLAAVGGENQGSPPPIRILTTGFDFDKNQKKMVQAIPGATLIEDIAQAHTATHVIATDGKTGIRRTSKLMIAICRTPNIVSLDWVTQSAKAQQALDCTKFLITYKKNDCLAMEQQYKFSMSTAIENIVRRCSAESNTIPQTALIFHGWSIFICPKVAGNRAPPLKEFRLIIEAAGAVTMPSLSSMMKQLSETVDSPKNCLLITSDPPTPEQMSQKSFQALIQKGAIHRTTTWFFHTIMKQEIDESTQA